MSTAIESTTIGGIEDHRLVLGNAQAARIMTIGSSWTTIRLGMRFCFDDAGANITGTPRFYFGVMSNPTLGLTNGPLSGASTSHFVGMISADTTWTRATVPTRYSWSTNAFYAKKVGSTITTASNLSVNTIMSADPTVTRRAMIMQIVKGSPNFSITIITSDNAGAVTDMPYTAILTAMEIATMAGVNTFLNATYGTYSGGSNSANLAVNEASNGELNAICLAWDRTTTNIHCSELLFTQFP
jgi:hypothetical protein